MTDEVVPIAPGVEIGDGRPRALLDHVAACLAEFPGKNDGEQPEDIIFVIVGANGTSRTQWLIGSRWRSTVCLASVQLAHEAME